MIDFIYRRGNKWTLMFIDSILVVLSIVAAFGLRFNFKIPSTYLVHMAYGLPFTLLIRVSLFLVFKTHTGLIKYSGFDDIKRIVYSIAFGSLGFYLLNPRLLFFTNTCVDYRFYVVWIFNCFDACIGKVIYH